MEPHDLKVAVEAQQQVFILLNQMHDRLMDKNDRADSDLASHLQGILSAVVGHFTELAMLYADNATDPVEQRERYCTFNDATSKIFNQTMHVCSEMRWAQKQAQAAPVEPENVIPFTPTKPGS